MVEASMGIESAALLKRLTDLQLEFLLRSITGQARDEVRLLLCGRGNSRNIFTHLPERAGEGVNLTRETVRLMIAEPTAFCSAVVPMAQHFLDQNNSVTLVRSIHTRDDAAGNTRTAERVALLHTPFSQGHNLGLPAENILTWNDSAIIQHCTVRQGGEKGNDCWSMALYALTLSGISHSPLYQTRDGTNPENTEFILNFHPDRDNL